MKTCRSAPDSECRQALAGLDRRLAPIPATIEQDWSIASHKTEKGRFVSVMRCNLQVGLNIQASPQHVRDAARVTRPAALAVISMRVKVPTASECLIAVDDSHVPAVSLPEGFRDGNSICQIRFVIVYQLKRLNRVWLLTPVQVPFKQSHSVIAGGECDKERGMCDMHSISALRKFQSLNG